MGFMTVDYSKAQQGADLLPEGTYDFVIEEAEWNVTRGGTEYLSITLAVREDIAQPERGERIEWEIWKRKVPKPTDPAGLPGNVLQMISRCVQLESGKKFDSIDEWIRAITNKAIVAEIKHKEYQGRPKIEVGYIRSSDQPNVAISPDKYTTVDDDTLPF